MNHPLMSVSLSSRKSLFWWLFLFTLGVMVSLNLVSKPLITPAAPNGIVSYELAGTPQKAQEILDSWNYEARLHAAFSLGFDYLFMGLYSTTIALACLWGSRVMHAARWPGVLLGILLAWSLWLAAVSDGIENVALSLILFNVPAAPWPQIAQVCAILKFLLIFAGLIYVFLALIVRFWKRPEGGASSAT
jgi:uncharacterized membrane protein YhaH (DUF805 family)